MKNYKVKLTKIRSNHSELRTDVIEGETTDLPQVGKRFMLVGKGLEFGSRLVTTTEIQKLEKLKNEFLFHTLNSTYKLEVLGEVDSSDNVAV